MKVERYNYASQINELKSLLKEIEGVLVSGQYILSDKVLEFEKQFANYLNVPYAKGVNSGTDALIIAIQALQLPPNSEIVTQANTFYATVAAIIFAGHKPVLVDAQEETFLMDQTQLEAVLTPNTKAIIPVHLYGKPTPMDSLIAFATRHSLAVIEDAAQAHGAKFRGKCVGTYGDFGCFSFHPSKNLAAAGDGGAIVCHNSNLNQEVVKRRALGQEYQNHHTSVSLNSKLDTIQALVLSHKLPFLNKWNNARREVADQYRTYLSDLPVRFQRVDPDEEHVYHLFQIQTEKRDSLLKFLNERGVDAVIRYPMPIHMQPAFGFCDFFNKKNYPVAEKLSKELLCLPIRPEMPTQEIAYVSDCIRKFFKGIR